MSWDIALAPTGDIRFSSSGDLAGISGTDLIEQRMMLRMKIQRGSWTYDEDGTLGSQLVRLTGMASQLAITQVDAYVREALRDMNEISIGDIDISQNGSALVLLINYSVVEETVSMDEENQQQLEVVISATNRGD